MSLMPLRQAFCGMNDDQLALSFDEKTRFEQLEAIVERGVETFVEVGNALLEIRNLRLYRREFSTFEDYCRQRWQLSRRHAYELISAAEVVSNLCAMAHTLPSNERQVRPLAKLEPEQQREAWQLTTVINPNPTAATR